MNPFNIVVRNSGKQLGLNIHPKDELSYMIFCEGALVGEIFLDFEGKAWGVITAKDLNYENYPKDEPIAYANLLENKAMVTQIGQEISKVVNFH